MTEKMVITPKQTKEFCLNVCKYKPVKRYVDAECQLPYQVDACPLREFIRYLLNPLEQSELDWLPSPFTTGDS